MLGNRGKRLLKKDFGQPLDRTNRFASNTFQIGRCDKVCKYCGTHQFGENDEFYPTEEQVQTLARMIEQSNRNEIVASAFF